MRNQFKIVSLFLLVCTTFCLYAQNADCDNLLFLEDSVYHSGEISGFGVHKEFDGNHLEHKKLFEKEANSIWYLIKMPASGEFAFDVVTESEEDDWDFLLYKNSETLCDRFKEKIAEPIRSNLSRSPITGIAKGAKDDFVSAGINNNYSRSVFAQEGDEFVLVVNNPKRSGGQHTLKLHLPQKKELEIIDLTKLQPLNTNRFKLEIKDAATKKPLVGYVSLLGLEKERVKVEEVSEYVHFVPKKNRKVNVEAYSEGYMLLSEEFKVSKTKSKYLAEVFLEKIEVGKKVNLTKIQFYGDQFNLLPSAKPSLKSLLLFMERNPSVTIEIGGHVNGPGERNSKRYKELSYNRAYAVKADLVKNGVSESRIDFKGYGNSQMLYSSPKSPYQESANRRVEIKILSK
jgi:outer membrane protein OmpA-like peptidoglycan-associated protein